MVRGASADVNATLSVFHQRHIGRCCDHRAFASNEDLHRHAAENIAQAHALLFGQVTYEMMEAGWRRAASHPLAGAMLPPPAARLSWRIR